MDKLNEDRLQLVRELVTRAGCVIDFTRWCPIREIGLLGWSTPEAEIVLRGLSTDFVEHARARVVTALSRHGWRESALTWIYEQITLGHCRLTLHLPIHNEAATP
jgi:hypothetical protein